MITFVTFHVAISSETRQELSKITVSLRQGDRAAYQIRLLFQSVRAVHPDCRCILMTDEHTPFEPQEGVEIIRCPVSSEHPHWSRLSTEMELLKRLQGEPETHIAFLDCDILCLTSAEAAFSSQPDFDVALTYRADPTMPINAGVKLVKAGHIPQALCFFEAYKQEFQSRREDLWWGEQLSLAQVAGPEAFTDNPPPIVEQDGFRIALLPCRRFNCSPGTSRSLRHIPHDVVFLHFKGRRKRYMEDYWAVHNPNEPAASRTAARLRTAFRNLVNL